MSRNEQWGGFLKNCTQLIHPSSPFLLSGTITRVSGLVMEAVGLKLAVGSSCTIFLSNSHSVSAEVVGFSGERLFLMPSSDVYGLSPGAKVVPAKGPVRVSEVEAEQKEILKIVRQLADDGQIVLGGKGDDGFI